MHGDNTGLSSDRGRGYTREGFKTNTGLQKGGEERQVRRKEVGGGRRRRKSKKIFSAPKKGNFQDYDILLLCLDLKWQGTRHPGIE